VNDLETLLEFHRPRLVAFFAKRAGPLLLRFETPEDLAQGAQTEALRAKDGFEYRDESTFLGWLFTIARRHLSARRDHWFALKRNRAGVLRLTWDGGDANGDVAGTRTGPGTFAERREELVLITRAMDLLPDRDRQLVRWTSEDVPLAEQAERLGIGYHAAEKARTRAVERLRKAFTLINRNSG
jgi:RNA polymerase sigma factor (sigma-70 family)